MKSVAVNFQLRKLSRRIMKSKTAFRGIPRSVPIDMKSGKVYATPKLMLKLNTTPSAELAQIYPHGTSDTSSNFRKCNTSTIGQRKNVLKSPNKVRKRAI